MHMDIFILNTGHFSTQKVTQKVRDTSRHDAPYEWRIYNIFLSQDLFLFLTT